MDEWSGLAIGWSTREDARRLLGDPRKDSISRLKIRKVENWITIERKKKIWRRLEYRNLAVEGNQYRSVILFFKDNQLVLLDLRFDKNSRPKKEILGSFLLPGFLVYGHKVKETRIPAITGSGPHIVRTTPTRHTLVGATRDVFACAEIDTGIVGTSAGSQRDSRAGGILATQV